jgi:hypothetical protein
MLLKNLESIMKELAAIIILIAVSGCVAERPMFKNYGTELAHKCQIDPYNHDCLQPPSVLHN